MTENRGHGSTCGPSRWIEQVGGDVIGQCDGLLDEPRIDGLRCGRSDFLDLSRRFRSHHHRRDPGARGHRGECEAEGGDFRGRAQRAKLAENVARRRQMRRQCLRIEKNQTLDEHTARENRYRGLGARRDYTAFCHSLVEQAERKLDYPDAIDAERPPRLLGRVDRGAERCDTTVILERFERLGDCRRGEIFDIVRQIGREAVFAKRRFRLVEDRVDGVTRQPRQFGNHHRAQVIGAKPLTQARLGIAIGTGGVKTTNTGGPRTVEQGRCRRIVGTPNSVGDTITQTELCRAESKPGRFQAGLGQWRALLGVALQRIQHRRPFCQRDGGQAPLSKTELAEAIGVTDIDGLRLVTVHSETNAPLPLAALDAVLDALDANPSLTLLTAANSDPGGTRERIVSYVNERPWASFIESLGSKLYPNALRHAAVMLGNSSSGLIEAGLFGLPVIDVGDRQRGRDHGENVIHAVATAASVQAALTRPFARYPALSLYGDGRSGPRVAAAWRAAANDIDLVRKSPPAIDLPTDAVSLRVSSC